MIVCEHWFDWKHVFTTNYLMIIDIVNLNGQIDTIIRQNKKAKHFMTLPITPHLVFNVFSHKFSSISSPCWCSNRSWGSIFSSTEQIHFLT